MNGDPVTTVVSARDRALATWVNLLVPGGGLILLGRIAVGLAVGVLFTVACNAAIAASLLVPDDFGPLARTTAILTTALTYVAAQYLLIRAANREHQTRREHDRRAALRACDELLAGGDVAGARLALDRVSAEQGDLHAAVLRARVLSAAERGEPARRAWIDVRNLDRHQLYRLEADRNLQSLRDGADGRSRPAAP